MRYAVQGGGKRLRPLLALAACQAAGGLPRPALRAACAVEIIHAYSLVHDDMPCMDNDVLRRGKPTVHVQFGQAQALLAGDALQALAFEILTPDDEQDTPPAMQAALCRLLARAAGAAGMAGGQAIDLASVGQPLSEERLRAMHRCKTGALLQASVRMGAACAEQALPPAALAALDDYGAAIGLAFQVVDDVLDVTADSQALGKTASKDAAANKPTYVSLMGLPAARRLADELLAPGRSRPARQRPGRHALPARPDAPDDSPPALTRAAPIRPAARKKTPPPQNKAPTPCRPRPCCQPSIPLPTCAASPARN